MKEYVKKFNTLETIEGYKIDNPFISAIVSTGQNFACVDGEYITVKDNLVEIVHMVPKPANNEFYYRTVLNEPVYPNKNTLLGENDTILNIVSNTYDESFKGYRMVLDGNLVKVGDNAFYKTCGFTYIRFPDSLERLCYRSFRQCSDQWMFIHFGSGIKYIDNEVFHATMIKNLVFPPSLISVGDAFWYSGIDNEDGILRLPAGISYGWLFANAWAFNTIIFEEGITEIGQLFNGAEASDVKHIILPTTLRIIGDKTFSNNPLLTEITLPTGLQSIGDYSFYGIGLTSITIPENVQYVGACPFRNCQNLRSVRWNAIDCTIYEDGKYVYPPFSGSTNLNSFVIGENVESLPKGLCYGMNISSIVIPNSVLHIGDYVFSDCSNLSSITIGNSVASIGEYAFRNCNSLTSVTIPNSVTSIGKSAFYNCTGLTSVTIPNNVTSIGNSAFRSCSGLTSIEIPNSVTSIGKSAFYNCTGLTSVTIPNGVTTIGDYAFRGCSGLTSLSVEAGNTVYDSRNNCNAIIETSTNNLIFGCQNTTIPNNITSIGMGAFYGCTDLTTVSIPSSVTNIGEYAFVGLANVQSITVDSNNQVYDSRNNCNAIIETATNKLIAGNIDITTIPDTVTTIGYGSFAMSKNNTRTNSVDIPTSITAIEKWAFELIPTLTTVTCRAINPPTLDALAFEGSSNIAHIYVPAESVDTYKAATNWSAFESIIEAIPSAE